METKRKRYESPRMKVVALQQKYSFLLNSPNGLGATKQSYGTANESDGTVQNWNNE
jgi:hypothetical protein